MIQGCGVGICAVDESVPGLTPGGALRGSGSTSPAPTTNGRLRLGGFFRAFMAMLVLVTMGGAAWAGDGETAPARDPKQAVDEAYTAKMKRYTTAPYFTSPLVDYLPASKNVPTPEVVLGDVAGAPGNLPYSKDVYKYMRLLEKASPRVKVYSIGTTEEGREMIAVAMPRRRRSWRRRRRFTTSRGRFTLRKRERRRR
jgi:hypothetical protein